MRKGRKIKLIELENRPGWECYEIEDIVSLGRGGAFGLYFRQRSDSWTPTVKPSLSINNFVDVIKSKSETISLSRTTRHDPRLTLLAMYDVKGEAAQLEQKFIQFCNDHPVLLEQHRGLHRLATDNEIEIFQSCQTGSVKYMDENGGISGAGIPIYFGFFLLEGECYSPGLLLPKQPLLPNDLYVFEEQIEAYEESKTACSKKNDEQPKENNGTNYFEVLYGEISKITEGSSRNKLANFGPVLTAIFKAVKNIDPNFDADFMPGKVQDLYDFFKVLAKKIPILNDYTRVSKDTFREYCKGKKTSAENTPYCTWTIQQSSGQAYWNKIANKLLSNI